ncbi:hypothetical protein [Aequorivita echinoideorum]|uniref:Uncharacterized protein n=1 Tax=Aequorivita echinoideorum TaxID=1549647 RepID=A0ABS5S367_9FLAO|nr:hypothetical protein [Aequorivita echinoideorum]MBT0607657.1 hypothetical protein [Aequorivita echinoideorum]
MKAETTENPYSLFFKKIGLKGGDQYDNGFTAYHKFECGTSIHISCFNNILSVYLENQGLRREPVDGVRCATLEEVRSIISRILIVEHLLPGLHKKILDA